jgi:gluconokinase
MVRAGRVLVVMGVSGSGKTTIGQRLAASLGWAFQDADDLHPAANIHKMVAGHPAVRLLYLYGTPNLLRARMQVRTGHFMAPSMLDSQLATLEPPVDSERPICVSVIGTPEETTSAALLALAA